MNAKPDLIPADEALPELNGLTARYRGLPVAFMRLADGRVEPCPFLMSEADVADLFRLRESKTKFPDKTIRRYRSMGLRSVRVGRRVWFRLDDCLRFLDEQDLRLTKPKRERPERKPALTGLA